MQLFSRSVAAAMYTCIATTEFNSSTAIVLKSRALCSSNPYRCTLSEKHETTHKILTEAFETFKNIKKIDFNEKVTTPPCFDEMIISISSTLALLQ